MSVSMRSGAGPPPPVRGPLACRRTGPVKVVRAGIADALATVTPALLTPGRDRPPAAILRGALYGHASTRHGQALTPGRRTPRHWPGPSICAYRWPPWPTGRDPAAARHPGPAAGWEPRGGCDHHPQAGRLPRLPRLRGRTRPPRGQPSKPHLMAAAGIPVRGRPAVSCYPCRGCKRSWPRSPGSARS